MVESRVREYLPAVTVDPAGDDNPCFGVVRLETGNPTGDTLPLRRVEYLVESIEDDNRPPVLAEISTQLRRIETPPFGLPHVLEELQECIALAVRAEPPIVPQFDEERQIVVQRGTQFRIFSGINEVQQEIAGQSRFSRTGMSQDDRVPIALIRRYVENAHGWFGLVGPAVRGYGSDIASQRFGKILRVYLPFPEHLLPYLLRQFHGWGVFANALLHENGPELNLEEFLLLGRSESFHIEAPVALSHLFEVFLRVEMRT